MKQSSGLASNDAWLPYITTKPLHLSRPTYRRPRRRYGWSSPRSLLAIAAVSCPFPDTSPELLAALIDAAWSGAPTIASAHDDRLNSCQEQFLQRNHAMDPVFTETAART
jgi:hypothetical protein